MSTHFSAFLVSDPHWPEFLIYPSRQAAGAYVPYIRAAAGAFVRLTNDAETNHDERAQREIRLIRRYIICGLECYCLLLF